MVNLLRLASTPLILVFEAGRVPVPNFELTANSPHTERVLDLSGVTPENSGPDPILLI